MGGPTRESLVTEARAKITWGSPPEEVERALVKKGATPAEARTIVRELVDQRQQSFRQKGTRDIIAGSAMLFGGLFGAVWMWNLPRVIVQVMVMFLLLAGIGISVGVRGVIRVATGGSEEGHDSDVSD